VSYERLREELFNPVGVAPGDIVAIDPLWHQDLLEEGLIEDARPALLSFIDVLYYNVELLKDAGFTRPPKSRAEFINCARALTNKEKSREGTSQRFTLGLALGESNSRGIYDDIFPWIWAAGVQLIKDESPVLNSRQTAESLSFLASLGGEGFIDGEAFSTNTRKKLEDFISGKSAFMVAPASFIKVIRERMGEEAFGISSVPAPENYAGRPFYGSAEWAIGISSASSHKEEARLFADFLAGKASLLAEKAAPEGVSDPFYSKLWDISIAGESAQDFADFPWAEPEAIFREELVSLFAGRYSPAETAAAIQERLFHVFLQR
jgi:ABC-type glycerol-3-phosphate transport system substrate-binding protein